MVGDEAAPELADGGGTGEGGGLRAGGGGGSREAGPRRPAPPPPPTSAGEARVFFFLRDRGLAKVEAAALDWYVAGPNVVTSPKHTMRSP